MLLRSSSSFLIGVLALVSTQCRFQGPESPGEQSGLSTIGIGDFTPNGTLQQPLWSSARLTATGVQGTNTRIDAELPKQGGQKAGNSQVKVPQGNYTLFLSYQNEQGKTLYESCASDKSKVHAIFAPLYQTDIRICLIGTSTEVGTSSMADIEINPVLSDSSGSANSQGSVDAPLVACAASFPKGPIPPASSLNFETEKSSAFMRYTVASLAPCLLIADRCEESLKWVQSLTGAMGSVTQNLRNASGGDNPKFIQQLATDTGLYGTIGEHAACIKTQPGGVSAFMEAYARRVQAWIAP